ncbi:MAG: ABC-2 family transporter protein [Candidatus Paceibacterota bacterium]
MLKEIKFALYAIKKNIQSSAELRTSFLMNVFGMMINNSAFIILWVYFIKSVGVIGGWNPADIVGLQGFLALAFGIIFSFGNGIRKLPEYVSSGGFDRFMLSPKNLLVRIATASFNASAIGDMAFGIICLVTYAFLIHVTFYQIIAILILLIFSTIIFLALSIIIFSTSFFFMDSNAVSSGLFELFLTPSLFHGGSFQGIMRFIFTFILPSLLVGTLPVETVKDMSILKLSAIGLFSFIWMFISIKIFNKAVKKYESSNFMTFGN